ncbi:penicillin-binding protein 2 (pbp-2) [hydrocarbon metagenome]|uniref:Penicillin-binding protein 2 (Pbp-2) n=1 Tax=hydrocarbon metagenome TaxID=938273 RepID=A0A0W8FTQ5_9ZZZZ
MKKQPNLLSGQEPSQFKQKFNVVGSVLLIALFLLLVRLGYLQIIKGDEFRQKSENNSVRFRNLKPLRGLIMDRNRVVLVDNKPSFDVIYIPNKNKGNELSIEKLKNLYRNNSLELSYDQSVSKTTKPYLPVKLERNVGMEKIALIETNALDLPGIYIDVSPIRLYLNGEMLAPIIGYTGEISKEDLGKNDGRYTYGDVLGKHGVEKFFDSYIRGRRGAELVEVNVYGKEIKNLGRIDPVSGCNIVLNIDADLQKATGEALSGRSGAAVVLDVRDGSILAMFSAPSFDPNLFNSGISYEQWEKLKNNPLCPLSNKAISGQYPPGSTYKLIVAAAALEEGVINPETKIFCNGSFTLGNRTYRCWKKGGHGSVNLHQAIVESCDVYFYTVGKMLGVDKIAEYAKRFGLGGVAGIDLPNEKSGLVPTKDWKLKRKKSPWLMGETISISIGQGFNLVTPLQLANAFSAFANGGTLWRPRLVKYIETTDGKLYKQFLPEKEGELKLSPKTVEILNSALWGVVNEPGGTGKNAKLSGVDVCGKTGTSQVLGLPENEIARRAKRLAAFQKDHALFACYAPLKNPEIAVAVILEHAGGGGAVAAPVARKILSAYFDGKKKDKKTVNSE